MAGAPQVLTGGIRERLLNITMCTIECLKCMQATENVSVLDMSKPPVIARGYMGKCPAFTALAMAYTAHDATCFGAVNFKLYNCA
jgi:hypothetical protein